MRIRIGHATEIIDYIIFQPPMLTFQEYSEKTSFLNIVAWKLAAHFSFRMAQSERKLTGGFCWVILLNEKRYAGKNHGYRGPMYSRLKNLVTLHDLAYSKPCSSHPTLNATSTYAPSLNWGGSLCQPTSPVARGCYYLARPVKKCGDLLLLQSIYTSTAFQQPSFVL